MSSGFHAECAESNLSSSIIPSSSITPSSPALHHHQSLYHQQHISIIIIIMSCIIIIVTPSTLHLHAIMISPLSSVHITPSSSVASSILTLGSSNLLAIKLVDSTSRTRTLSQSPRRLSRPPSTPRFLASSQPSTIPTLPHGRRAAAASCACGRRGRTMQSNSNPWVIGSSSLTPPWYMRCCRSVPAPHSLAVLSPSGSRQFSMGLASKLDFILLFSFQGRPSILLLYFAVARSWGSRA